MRSLGLGCAGSSWLENPCVSDGGTAPVTAFVWLGVNLEGMTYDD